MLGKLKLVYPDKDEQELTEFLNKKINKTFKDHECLIHNNHQDKQAKSSLLQLTEFIHDVKPIIGGQGVLYKNQYQSPNPSAGMLEDVMNRRDAIKKERKKCAEGSYEWLMKDIGQDNMKRVANSFYGANGAPTSTFYNLYTAASVTGTGQALISTAMTSYESLMSNNCKFFDMDEGLLFIDRVCHQTTYKSIRKVDKIDDVRKKAYDRIVEMFKYKQKIDYDILDRVFENLTEEDCYKLYFKNNIEAFFTQVPEVRKILSHIVNEVKEFRDPNKLPEGEEKRFARLYELCEELAVYNFPVRSRIDRDKYEKRQTGVVQDTDSTMLTISKVVHVLVDNYMNDEVAAESEMDIRFILVNTIAYFLTRYSQTFLARYARDTNIPDPYDKLLILKNEFYYPLLVTTSTKKRYLSKMMLQEGKLIDPPRIDVHGLDFAKAETSDRTKAFFDHIIKEYIMDAETIDVGIIFHKLKEFGREIEASILAGNMDYLTLKAVKEPDAYTDPLSEQGIKAVTNWNLAYPNMEISLPDRIMIVKVAAGTRSLYEKLEPKMPKDKFELYRDNIFYSKDSRIARQGLTVIGIPQNVGKIPQWIVDIADIPMMVYDNISKFNPVLQSLGTIPLKSRANMKHMSNIIDL
jgi:hypothetical protein